MYKFVRANPIPFLTFVFLQRPRKMGAAGRQRFGDGRRTRGPADSRNRRARSASELRPFVGVQRHRPLPAENTGPV